MLSVPVGGDTEKDLHDPSAGNDSRKRRHSFPHSSLLPSQEVLKSTPKVHEDQRGG